MGEGQSSDAGRTGEIRGELGGHRGQGAAGYGLENLGGSGKRGGHWKEDHGPGVGGGRRRGKPHRTGDEEGIG